MLLALVLVSWGEEAKLCQGLRARRARQGFLLLAWWRAEGNAGKDIPEHTGFLQTPPAAISLLPMSAPSPFLNWNLHHPVPIKPALEVKVVDTSEEVVSARKHLLRQRVNSHHSLWSFPHGNSCWGCWWDLWHPPLSSFFLRVPDLLASVSHSVTKSCFCHLSPEILSLLRQGNCLISAHMESCP